MSLAMQTDAFDDMLDKFKQISDRAIPDLVRANARLVAVQLANRTQPFTKDPSSGPSVLEKVSKGVSTDVRKVIKDEDSLETYIHGAIQDDKIKERLLQVARAKRYDILAKIMFNCGIITSESNIFLLSGEDSHKATHLKFRDGKGKTFSPPGEKHISQSGLKSYIEAVLKRIGYAKSGWAECAREIGGIKGDGARGIPAFAKRQRGSNFSVDKQAGPTYAMTNETPYIDKVCDSSQQNAAVNFASANLIKSLETAFRAASIKGSNIKEVTESEIDKTL